MHFTWKRFAGLLKSIQRAFSTQTTDSSIHIHPSRRGAKQTTHQRRLILFVRQTKVEYSHDRAMLMPSEYFRVYKLQTQRLLLPHMLRVVAYDS